MSERPYGGGIGLLAAIVAVGCGALILLGVGALATLAGVGLIAAGVAAIT